MCLSLRIDLGCIISILWLTVRTPVLKPCFAFGRDTCCQQTERMPSVLSQRANITDQGALTSVMPTGRPKTALELSVEEETELRGFSSSRSLPHALVARAKLVLWSAEGKSNTEIAFQLKWTKATVGRWRPRFIERRFSGLYDELRPGGPRLVSDEKVALLLRRTLKNKPPVGSHWSLRQAASTNELSKSTVHRVFPSVCHSASPQQNFKLSSDPFFVEKVSDVVGLYLNPPDHAIVLSVDEKSQIQALDRTQPVLPMGLGYVEGVTHDYVSPRHHYLVCRPRHRFRHCPDRVQGTPSSSGVS